MARPLPIEYLLIDMSVGFPLIETNRFETGQIEKSFPVENRIEDKQVITLYCYIPRYKWHIVQVIVVIYSGNI